MSSQKSFPPTAVILNERSGDGREDTDRADRLRAALDAAGVAAIIRSTAEGLPPDALARDAIAKGAGRIVAAGGDGTAAAVAGPCSAAGLQMGLVPLGTFNYFARSQDIPLDLDGAVQLIAEGADRPVALSLVNDRVFLNNASIGLYPEILGRRETAYSRMGRSRAVAYWSVLRTLALRPRSLKLRVSLDGRPIKVDTPLAFVANSAYQLDLFSIDGAQALREGQLALLSAPRQGRAALARSAFRMARGKPRKGPDFTLHTAHEIEIRPPTRRLTVACDGERVTMTAPLVFRRADRPLHLIAAPDGQA